MKGPFLCSFWQLRFRWLFVALLLSAPLPVTIASDLSPSFGFSSVNRFRQAATDLDEQDGARNFTSEALFSESSEQLGRPLTDDELRAIAREKVAKETFTTITFRPQRQTVLSAFVRARDTRDAQITVFREPTSFNDVSFREVGGAAQHMISFANNVAVLRGAVRDSQRTGLIEFSPGAEELVRSAEVSGALISPLREGTDLALYGTYVRQNISQSIPESFHRRRNIFAASFSIGQHPSPDDASFLWNTLEGVFERRFDQRGQLLYGGLVVDEESFGAVEVRKRDFYLGTSVRVDPLHVGLLSSILTSDVEGDVTQSNAQLYSALTVYLDDKPWSGARIRVPVTHEVAVEGPHYFDNWKGGVEIGQQWGGNANERTSIELITSLSYQDFYKVNKDHVFVGGEVRVRY